AGTRSSPDTRPGPNRRAPGRNVTTARFFRGPMADGGPRVPPLAYVRRPPGAKQSGLTVAPRHGQPEMKMQGITRMPPARDMAKWCACALILLAPGSFVIVPLLWLARQWTARGMLPARSQ